MIPSIVLNDVTCSIVLCLASVLRTNNLGIISISHGSYNPDICGKVLISGLLDACPASRLPTMFSKFWSSKSTNDKDEQITSIPNKISRKTEEDLGPIRAQLESIPTPLLALIAFSLGVASSTGGALLYARYGRRIRNADWITPDLFAKKRWIRGIVTRSAILLSWDSVKVNSSFIHRPV